MTWLTILVLALATAASSHLYGSRSAVTTVTESAQIQRGQETTVVHFYTAGSMKDQRLKADFEKVAKQMSGLVNFVAVDVSDDEHQLAEEFGVDSTPTIMVCKGEESVEYDGDHTVKAIVAYVNDKVESQVKELTAKSHKKFVPGDHQMPKVVLMSKGKGDDDVHALFNLLSERLKGRMEFASMDVSKKKVKKIASKTYDVTDFPAIVALPAWDGDEDFDAPQRQFSGKMKGYALSAFLELHALPSDREVLGAIPQMKDESCMEALCEKRGGLCVITLLSAYDKQQLGFNLASLRQIELSRRDTLFSFSWLDSVEQMDFIDSAFGLQPQEYPQVVVFSPSKLRFTTFVGAFTSEDVSTFLSRVGKGSIVTDPIFSEDRPALIGDTTECEGMVPDDTFSKSNSKSEEKTRGETTEIYRLPKSASKKGKLHDITLNWDTVTKTASNWLVLFSDSEEYEDLNSEFERAAAGTKGMVAFGRWDLHKNKDAPILSELGAEEGSIFVFKAGTNKASEWEVYNGETGAKHINRHAMSLLTDDLVSFVPTHQHLNQWAGPQALQPKLLLITEKSKSPSLLNALSIEYDRFVACGYAPPESEVARSFLQGGLPDGKSVLLFLQPELQEDVVPGTDQQQIGLRAQQFPPDMMHFNMIGMQLDQLTNVYPSSRPVRASKAEADDEEFDEHDEL